MDKESRIVIIDDNKSVLNSLSLYLKYKFKHIVTCSNPNQIPSILDRNRVDVVLLDMNFTAGLNTGNEGLFWMKEILKVDPDIVVILITAYGDVELAVNAMKEGAADFVLKPWDNNKLLATIQSGLKLRQTQKRVKALQDQQQHLQEDLNHGFEFFIGESSAMREVLRTIHKVAGADVNVLITGENGTGKELVAREIHRLSPRSGNIFMGVDLGALSESLFESELFGHVRGAFTDAKEDRLGRIQTASGGTLFLDEIGNISEAMQAKLLAALQNREITPVGSNKPITVDVRLISATNRDLSQMVKDSTFREDLMYRINTIQIHLPPLKDRGNDVILLARHFLVKYSERYEKQYLRLDEKTGEHLLQYSWPGNVRELQHAMERAVILCEGDSLMPDDFNLYQGSDLPDWGNQPMSMEEAEKIIIQRAMKRNKGNVSNVARELNIGRQTLYRKLQKYNL